MKPSTRHMFFAAIVLLCGGVWVLRPDIARSTNTADAEKGISSRMRSHERQLPTTPIDRLRALTQTPISRAPSFDTVDRWATGLTDCELRKLIEETGMEEDKDLAGWLRCALFAEWGRRDPEAARQYLRGFDLERERHAFAQSWFSVFRGWASKDPDAALAALREFEADPPLHDGVRAKIDRDDAVIRCSTRAIFTALALKDPEHAWQLAQGSLKESGAMEGIARGAAGSEALQLMLVEWVRQICKKPVPQPVTEEVSGDSVVSLSGSALREEDLLTWAVALAIGANDIDRGAAWISSLGDVDSSEGLSLMNYHMDWARNHPEEALALLELDSNRKYHRTLACGLLKADPSFGPQVMALMPDDHDRCDLANEFTITLGSYYDSDFFPAPGQRNPLHDFEAAYHQVLETIAAAKLPADQQARLLEKVNHDFSYRVPAAAEALKGPSRKY